MAATQHIDVRRSVNHGHNSGHLDDNVESLRHILSSQQRREVGYEEAQEVSASLVEFYQILAEEIHNEPTE